MVRNYRPSHRFCESGDDTATAVNAQKEEAAALGADATVQLRIAGASKGVLAIAELPPQAFQEPLFGKSVVP